MIDSIFLKQKLEEVVADPQLGVKVVPLATSIIGDVPVTNILIHMAAGKGLRPHVHERNGEIAIPLTNGVGRFGSPVKDTQGEYIWENDEVKIEWEEEILLEPGKSFEIPEGKAHDFHATESEEFMMLVVLPTDHLGEDRKWVLRP